MKCKTAIKQLCVVSTMIFAPVFSVVAEKEIAAYQLSYEEHEPGVDAYATQYIVSDRYIRINTLGDNDGFILYDDKLKTIYSVNHVDRRTLVMKNVAHKKVSLDTLVDISYQAMKNAPDISGKAVYDYRVSDKTGEKSLCTNMQIAQGLLPQVTKQLQNYKEVIAANQAANLFKMPEEFQTACFLSDQVYDSGEYYSKGLPILEWHSNNSKKLLLNYEQIKVAAEVFTAPSDYTEFSLNDSSGL